VAIEKKIMTKEVEPNQPFSWV